MNNGAVSTELPRIDSVLWVFGFNSKITIPHTLSLSVSLEPLFEYDANILCNGFQSNDSTTLTVDNSNR